MAIQTIYTLASNVKLESCKKGRPIPPLLISLLKSNYLGEFRTSVEKDKVLKNLGILGATGKYTYPSDTEVDSYKDIKTVLQALDYCIRLIQSYEISDKNIKQLTDDVKSIQTKIKDLDTSITTNTNNITEINKLIIEINKSITEFDLKLKDLNVDDKITNRLNQHLENSKTIELQENILEVKKSNAENNAIIINEDGVFVKDISELVEKNTEAIKNVNNSDKYNTNTTGTSPYTVGGIKEGTTAESLNGKTISDILDLMLFPTYVRDLIYPTLLFSEIPSLVEVNSSIVKPTLTFTLNDAGAETSIESTLEFNGSEYIGSTYNSIGTYIYKGKVEYSSGEYLTNNKGETTDLRIEAGTLSTSISTVATYPWYAGNINLINKLQLVPFNLNSQTLEVSLSGKAVIKLPGSNSQLLSFKVNGGLGFLDVDLNGWSESKEQINGEEYKVWTKNDEYSAVLPHQIQFKLVL